MQGSNNGSSWTDLHTVTDEDSWTASETKAYDEGDFTNTTAYRYYRLHITEAKFGSYAGVAELHLPAPPVGPDFRHDFEVTHQSGTTGRAAVWALSNDLDDVKNWDDDDDEAVSVTLVGAASPTLVLTDHESGASDTSTALTTQTTYYCTVERTADTTVECRIYSDLGRTTLVDTLSVSVTSGRTWRYLVACNSYNDNEADAISFDVENLRAGDETIDYYYNTAWQVVEERKDGSSDPLAQYVWDIRYIDAPVLRWRDDNLNGDFLDSNETLYYTQDANFNVTALVNTSGTVLERTMYDPYGKPTFYDANWANPSDSSDYANEVLYCGYRFDTETGLYHVRHRSYHPTLGRWLQRDRGGYVDGMSLYEYVRSNPVVYVDLVAFAAARPMPSYRGQLEAQAASGQTWKLPRDFDLVIVTGEPRAHPDAPAVWHESWKTYNRLQGSATKVVFVIPPNAEKIKNALVERYKEIAGEKAKRPVPKIEVKLKILYVGHGGSEFQQGLGVPEPPRGDPGDVWFESQKQAEAGARNAVKNAPISAMRNRIREIVFTNCALASTAPRRKLLQMIAEDLGVRSIKAGTRDLHTEISISGEAGADVYVTPTTPSTGGPRHYGKYIYDTQKRRTLKAKEEKGNGAGT